MSTLVTLIEELKAKQVALGLNETEFTDRLKLSRANWYLIKKGEREPSRDFLTAVMREFPELTMDVMNYMAHPDNVIPEEVKKE